MNSRPTERTRILEHDVRSFKASFRTELAALRAQVDALKEEVRQLRSENDLLALTIAGRKR